MCSEAAAQTCTESFPARFGGWRMLWGESGATTSKAAHADML